MSNENTTVDPEAKATPEPSADHVDKQPSAVELEPTPAKVRVTGTVYSKTDGAREQLAGALVFAKAKDGTGDIPRPAETGEDGTYELALAPGEWEITAWHKDRATPEAVTRTFEGNADGLDFDLLPGVPGFTVAGTVVWQDTKERIGGALVDATQRTARGAVTERRRAWTNKDGSFRFGDLVKPGRWKIVVLHAKALPRHEPRQVTIVRNESNLVLETWRRQGVADKRLGLIFFAALCVALVVIVALYVVAHQFLAVDLGPEGSVIVSMVNRAEEHIAATATVTTTSELSATVAGIRSSWEVISSTSPVLSMQDRQLVSAVIGDLEQSLEENRLEEARVHLDSLRHVVEPLLRGFFWARDPWRLLEVLWWALAGVLCNLIITTGGYLRWHRFYREGVFLHVAQLLTVPLLALVFVFLASNVGVKIEIAGTGEVTLDLSDTRILVAVSFLIGSRPWAIWRYMQETAGKITGQQD